MFSNEKQLDLSVGNQCNENCYYCFQKWKPRFWIDLKVLVKYMQAWREKWMKTIQMIGWETLYHPYIAEIILYAKKIWYTNVIVNTNWHRFWDIKFFKKIYKLIDWIELTVHSHIPKIQNYITWLETSYENSFKGLQNLKEHSMFDKLWIMSTLLNDNHDTYLDTLKYFKELGIKRVNLYYPVKWDNSIPLKDAVKIFSKAFDMFWKDMHLTLSWVQPCLFEDKYKSNIILCYERNEEKWNLDNIAEEKIESYKEIESDLYQTEKCFKCEHYKERCFWFWKNQKN